MKVFPSFPPATWRQRYEALRQHVLERRQVLEADPLGLIILFGQGVARWMQNWWEAPPPARPLTALPPPSRGPSTPLWQQQLTGLLTHMTAQHL